MMASAKVVEMSFTNNSPSQDSNHPADLFQSRYVTPGFKPFSYFYFLLFPRVPWVLLVSCKMCNLPALQFFVHIRSNIGQTYVILQSTNLCVIK